MSTNNLLRALGVAVRHRRERLGHTQETFAAEIVLNRTYYGDIERGVRNPSFRNLCSIATGLGVTLSSLIKDAERRLRR